MKPDEIIKITIGDLVWRNAILQARITELEAQLVEANDKVGKAE